MKRILAIVILVLVSTAMVQADIAPVVNYQGRLTDDAGAPVADGNYTMTFNIYASSGAPAPIWTSGQQSVAVSGGLFTYNLGSAVSLPHNIFDNQTRYLGIVVGSDPEISPRTRFTAAPYAYRALKADTAMSFTGADAFVHTAGDTITGNLFFNGDGDGDADGNIYIATDGIDLFLGGNDTNTVRLYGTLYGELVMDHGTNGIRRVDLSAETSGGRLRLYNIAGAEIIDIDAGRSGTAALELPDNAIDADEILNEPGIVSNLGSSPNLTTSSFVDIATVTITPPGPGYVYITAHCGIIFSNTTGVNGAYLQIDTTAGGGIISEDVFVFQSAFPNTATYCQRASVDKLYYVSDASTRTYRLEGARYASSTGDVTTTRSRIKAMYFPTSYGSVKTLVSDPGDFTDAEAVTISDDNGQTRTEYKVDLRELELKAKEAKIKALEAERELERAREALENESRE